MLIKLSQPPNSLELGQIVCITICKLNFEHLTLPLYTRVGQEWAESGPMNT